MIVNELINIPSKPYTRSLMTGDIKYAEIIKFLKKNCSEILAINKQTRKFLYRGMSEYKRSDAFIEVPRNNREPLGLSPSDHLMLIKAFRLVGFKAIRNETISVSSNFNIIEDFGKPFVIFPLNGFSYTWSERFDDIGGFSDVIDDELRGLNISNLTKETANLIVDKLGFTDKDITEAMESGHEIAITGPFVALRYKAYVNKLSKSIMGS